MVREFRAFRVHARPCHSGVDPQVRKQLELACKALKYNDSRSLLFGLIWSCLAQLGPVWRYGGLYAPVWPCQALKAPPLAVGGRFDRKWFEKRAPLPLSSHGLPRLLLYSRFLSAEG